MVRGIIAMKRKPEKKRIKEIENVYRTLGLQSEEVRKYLVALGTLPSHEEKEKKAVFIEAGTTSFGSGGLTHARLESATE
jgi:hypothetical protein